MAPLRHLRCARRHVMNVACVAAVLLLAAADARAQTSEELAEARQIFNEGKQLEDRKAWEAALARFNAVAKVKITPQVRFHIALCEENLGRIVQAIKGFELAAEEARSMGSSAAEVALNAPPRAEALRARVGAIRVELRGAPENAIATLDGAPLPAGELGRPTLVEPGHHVIELRRRGETLASQDVTVMVQEVVPVILGAGPLPVQPPALVMRPVPSANAVTAAPHAEGRSLAPVYAAGGVGVAALATSGVFWALRQGTISDVLTSCTDQKRQTGCSPTLHGAADRGRTYSALSGAFLGVGLAGAAASGVLLMWSPKKLNLPVAQYGVLRLKISPATVELSAHF